MLTVNIFVFLSISIGRLIFFAACPRIVKSTEFYFTGNFFIPTLNYLTFSDFSRTMLFSYQQVKNVNKQNIQKSSYQLPDIIFFKIEDICMIND